MKSHLLMLILASACFVACNKKDPEPSETPAPQPSVDNIAPVLTLNGKSVDTCYLQSPYTDPGATATDNNDGNLSPWIVVTGSVNTSQGGNHKLNYHVKDAAGNQATVLSRTVHVINTTDFLTGNYNVSCTCTAMDGDGFPANTTTGSYTASAAASQTLNNSFALSTLNIGAATVVPSTMLNGNSISVWAMHNGPFGSQITISPPTGGTVAISKNSFTIQSLIYSPTFTCTNVFVKQ